MHREILSSVRVHKIHSYIHIAGVDLSKILGRGKPKYWGRVKVGNNWRMHRRFSIIGGTYPGCPQVYPCDKHNCERRV